MPASLVSEVVDSELDPLGPDASLQQVTNVLATYNLVAIPVVDDDDHLLGAVTVDDVIDHMLPDDWRSQEFDEPHVGEVPGDA
jgi:Mg/Co/Ni transporter MgtE